MTVTAPSPDTPVAPATRQGAVDLHEQLVAHGLIIPVGVPGAFGRGAVFEDVLEHVNALISRLCADDGAQVFTYPPIIDRRVLEKVHYLDSFPHLCGSVHSFYGDPRAALRLAQRANAGEPWGEELQQTGVVLNPAACYPVYPSFTGMVPAEGRLVTMLNWVYRHEPSDEPTRMQSFRVREFVRVGRPDQVLAWRDQWLKRGLELLLSLGLPAHAEVASDPFFGRGARMLASAQKEQKLKFEVVIPVISEESPTAVCSFNYHQDHFGTVFEIRTDDDAVAHTACLGFGLERIVMALFRHHGFDPVMWPAEVRHQLWPSVA